MLPRPSIPRPSLPHVSRPSRDAVTAVLGSLFHPSPPSPTDIASRLGSLCRSSANTIDAALAFAALGTGIGVVAYAAYTAANAVLPLALLRGLFERLTP